MIPVLSPSKHELNTCTTVADTVQTGHPPHPRTQCGEKVHEVVMGPWRWLTHMQVCGVSDGVWGSRLRHADAEDVSVSTTRPWVLVCVCMWGGRRQSCSYCRGWLVTDGSRPVRRPPAPPVTHSPRAARSCRSSAGRRRRPGRSAPAGTPGAASVSGRGCWGPVCY